MNRLSARASGVWVQTPTDFRDVGSREHFDQALSRLVKVGQVRRVGRGLYDLPLISNILKCPASSYLDASIATAGKAGWCPDPAGSLSFCEPAGSHERLTYEGQLRGEHPLKNVKIDGEAIQLRHSGPSGDFSYVCGAQHYDRSGIQFGAQTQPVLHHHTQCREATAGLVVRNEGNQSDHVRTNLQEEATDFAGRAMRKRRLKASAN